MGLAGGLAANGQSGSGGGGGGVSIAQGTAAARPGTPATNFYFATDTGELSIANAGLTAWQAIAATSATVFKASVGAATETSIGSSGGTPALFFAQTGGSPTLFGVSNALKSSGDIDVGTAGRGAKVAEGSNAKQGTATLIAGSVVVANTSVTATSRIFLTSQADGGTPGFLRVSARTAGTSFTITSSSGTDTSTVAWEIFEVG